MFTEPFVGKERKGWIEMICGPMFSGKTEELIRRLRRALIAERKVAIFKPAIDTRYDISKLVSHNGTTIPCVTVDNSESIIALATGMEVIGIDEVQFLDIALPAVCEKLAQNGIRVIAAGLDMDFEGRPFGPVPQLLSVADYITKVNAICVKCGDIARFSYRTSADTAKILLGEKDYYEPRCRACYNAAGRI